MPRQTGLTAALEAQGLPVKVIAGHKTRGSSSFAPFGDIAHWTAGPRSGDRPSLNICINGREGLPGPLCNVFLPRGLTPDTKFVYVVADGRANHAGPGSYQGATGNTHLFGTETEWSGRPGELTEFQEWAWPRICAAYRSLGSRFTAGHDEFALPRGRKVDIGNYANTLRQKTQAVITAASTPTPKDWFDMATKEEHREVVREELVKILNEGTVSVLRSNEVKKISILNALGGNDGGMNAIYGTVLSTATEIAGLQQAILQLAENVPGVDGPAIIAAVKEATKQAVKGALPTEVTVPLNTKES